MSVSKNRERILNMIAEGDPFGVGALIAGEMDAKDAEIARLEAGLKWAQELISGGVKDTCIIGPGAITNMDDETIIGEVRKWLATQREKQA